MAQSTTQLRAAWRDFECNPTAMIVIDFGPDRIRVVPEGAEAFRALAAVLQAHHYDIKVDDTDSYCCRAIKGGTGKSLHSYGIAVDVNATTNPFILTPDNRDIRFSDKPTQRERAQDVKLGRADTDMTPEMIADVRAIKTKGGIQVFEWGGGWKDRKDAMHFELDVTPADLQAGIDPGSVKGPLAGKALETADDAPDHAPHQLMRGARGTDVLRLQNALAQRGFSPGTADGIFGGATENALRMFQSSQRLSASGIADEATLRALNLTGTTSDTGGKTMTVEEILRQLFGRLAGTQAGQTPASPANPPAPPAGQPNVLDVVQVLTNAIIAARGGQPAPPAADGTPAPTTPGAASSPTTVMSPIDQWFGGEALKGKKTALAVIAYVVLYIIQTVMTGGKPPTPAAPGVPAVPGAPGAVALSDTAKTTFDVLSTLVMGFGGLGVAAKVDRVVQILGLFAKK